MADQLMEETKQLYKGIVKQICNLEADIIVHEQKQRRVVALLVVQEVEERNTGYFYASSVKLLESLRVLYANELVEYRKELDQSE